MCHHLVSDAQCCISTTFKNNDTRGFYALNTVITNVISDDNRAQVA